MEENIKGASQVHGVSGSEIIRYVNEQYPQALRHVTPYFGYGVTQNERAPQALTPQYAPIDGRSLEDLMALAVKLSKNYTYFNEDLHPDGNWESFLKKDVSVLLASIICVDLSSIEKTHIETVKSIQLTVIWEDKKRYVQTLCQQIYQLFNLFNSWYGESLLLFAPKVGDLEGLVSMDLQAIIELKLAYNLKLFRKYLEELNQFKQIDLDYEPDFSDFHNVWNSESQEITGEVFKGKDNHERILTGLPKLRLVYRNLANALAHVTYSFRKYFLQSIEEKDDHKPDVTMLITFLRLYQHLQADMNELSSKYLELYYSTVLKMPRSAHKLDEAHVSFLLAENEKSYFLQKGSILKAGIREDGSDIEFELLKSLEVNKGKVASLKSMYISKYGKLAYSSFQLVTNLYASPVANSENGIGSPFEGSNFAWPPFGEEQAELSREAYTMTGADLGFAISSPIFFLAEGNRKIDLLIHFTPDSTKVFKRLLEDIRTTAEKEFDGKSISREDAFFRIFNQKGDKRNLSIFASGFRKWIQIDPSQINMRPVFEEHRDEWEVSAIGFSFLVDQSKPPITAYQPDILGGLPFENKFPIIKIVVNDERDPFAYSFLKDLRVGHIDINVEADRIKKVRLFNDFGELDGSQSFIPFGAMPSVGSYFLIGNSEIFKKELNELELQIEWQDIPATFKDFEEFYEQYDELPVNADAFRFKFSALVDNRFYPSDEDDELEYNLFKVQDEQQNGYTPLKKTVVTINDIQRLNFRPEVDLDPALNYTNDTQTGFFRVELSNPPTAFGHHDYQEIVSRKIQESAKSEGEEIFETPRQPYTPKIKSLQLAYKASTQIYLTNYSGDRDKPESFYHIHPFGCQALFSHGVSLGNELLPTFEDDGYFFIGLEGLRPPETLTLLLQLTTTESKGNTQSKMPDIEWSYLARDQWRPFKQTEILEDETNGFTQTGIVALKLPRNISMRNNIMPSGLFWIRAAVNGNVQLLCKCIDIRTQVVKARRLAINSDDELRLSLPAFSINELSEYTPQIAEILQPFESYSGKATENNNEYFARVSERLRHKNRAVTHWDFERLTLNRFHEIHQVKCLSHLSNPDDFKPEDGITLVVVPKKSSYTGLERPRFNFKMLQEIENYVRRHISPYVKVNVRNIDYEFIRIQCDIMFEDGAQNGQSLDQLKHDLDRFLCPWMFGQLKPLNIGGSIDEHIIQDFILGLPYVKFVTRFSILHIIERDPEELIIEGTTDSQSLYYLVDTARRIKGPDGSPTRNTFIKTRPWGVIVPDQEHLITMVNDEIIKDPEEIQPPIRFQNKFDIYKASSFIKIKWKEKKIDFRRSAHGREGRQRVRIDLA